MMSGPFTPGSERLSSASLPRHRALGWGLVSGWGPREECRTLHGRGSNPQAGLPMGGAGLPSRCVQDCRASKRLEAGERCGLRAACCVLCALVRAMLPAMLRASSPRLRKAAPKLEKRTPRLTSSPTATLTTLSRLGSGRPQGGATSTLHSELEHKIALEPFSQCPTTHPTTPHNALPQTLTTT
jgi:hypothetical protein